MKFAKTESEDEFSIKDATGMMFKALETLKNQGKRPVIVIDELQKLKEVYFNSCLTHANCQKLQFTCGG